MSATARAGAIVTTTTGVRVRIRLTPKSARDAIEGEETLGDGSRVVLARVRAVPENGAANVALERLVAKAAGVAKSRVTVVSGATSRIKTVDIDGEPDAIVERLNEVPIP